MSDESDSSRADGANGGNAEEAGTTMAIQPTVENGVEDSLKLADLVIGNGNVENGVDLSESEGGKDSLAQMDGGETDVTESSVTEKGGVSSVSERGGFEASSKMTPARSPDQTAKVLRPLSAATHRGATSKAIPSPSVVLSKTAESTVGHPASARSKDKPVVQPLSSQHALLTKTPSDSKLPGPGLRSPRPASARDSSLKSPRLATSLDGTLKSPRPASAREGADDRRQPARTVPKPFEFATEKRSRDPDAPQPAPTQSMGKTTPRPGALPVSLKEPKVPPKPLAKPSTQPQPFNLASVRRHEEAMEKLKAAEAAKEVEELKQRSFKAQPVRRDEPFVPAKGTIPPTKPASFKLHVDDRKPRREEFEKARTEAELRREDEKKQKQDVDKEKERLEEQGLRKSASFKANPIRYVPPEKVFKPQKSMAAPTKGKAPPLGPTSRKRSSSEAEGTSSEVADKGPTDAKAAPTKPRTSQTSRRHSLAEGQTSRRESLPESQSSRRQSFAEGRKTSGQGIEAKGTPELGRSARSIRRSSGMEEVPSTGGDAVKKTPGSSRLASTHTSRRSSVVEAKAV